MKTVELLVEIDYARTLRSNKYAGQITRWPLKVIYESEVTCTLYECSPGEERFILRIIDIGT